ncbi:hypothetical protein EDD18DRAFT_1354264 [Armillaria luteobubalina]|uniref:DUF6534 domain-containing protein n=1 Tax=Armillaria luteobubalina TaxID=153913 RepID=A0AA39UWF8_9AGAR|nr:hypothetical protein EDD18DRAFT_1354264 [Armillaria luteobubalina]
MDSTPAPIPLLGVTLGAPLFGIILSAILFGILILQSLWYFKKFPDDWWPYRLAVRIAHVFVLPVELEMYLEQVAFIFVLDTLELAVSTHALYFLLIETRIVGNLLALDQIHVIWSCKLRAVFGTSVKVMVQAIYALRLWKVRQHLYLSRVVPCFLAFMMVCDVGAGIYLIYGLYSVSMFSDFPAIKNEMIAVISTSTAVDFSILIIMCHYLNRGRAASVFSGTGSMLVALMRLSLISGLVTSVCLDATLITFLISPNTLIFVAIDLLKPGLYSNSLLALCVPSAVVGVHEFW